MATRITSAKSLEEATTFKARTVGVNFIRHGDDADAELADREDITFQPFRTAPAAVPTIAVTRNGETAVFGPAHAPDNQNYRIRGPGDDDDKWLWTWSGYPIQHANGYWEDYNPIGRKYHIPAGFYADGETGDLERYAVFGLETAPTDMPSHNIRATYDGQVRLAEWHKTNGSRDNFRGDIELVADFSENTIEGVIDNWKNAADGESEPFVYLVKKAAISGNGFTSSMAPSSDCIGCATVIDSVVAGKFYGPYADETGGTIQVEYRSEEGEYVGLGVFYTNRD